MGSEVFRFVTVRPPQEVNSLQASAADTIDLSLGTSSTTTISLSDRLRALRSDGDRDGMVAAAAAFIASTGFIDSPKEIDKNFADFILAVRGLSAQNFWSGAGSAVTNIFKVAPSAVVKSDAFVKLYNQTSDSIIAATIDQTVSPKVRALLTTSARALWLIRRLAASTQLSQRDFARAPMVLPAGIFPLPPEGTSQGELRQASANGASLKARNQRLDRLSADLEAHRHAVDELLITFVKDGTGASSAAAPSTGAGAPAVTFALPVAASEQLSKPTKDALRAAGFADTAIDVAKAVPLLENRAAELARKLYADASVAKSMVRIGNSLIPRADAVGESAVTVEADPGDLRTPGACAPAASVALPTSTVTVPTGHGDAKVLGIADLNILEQQLLRYELGEIAHIENVLKSETRSRTFKTSSTVEQTQTTETETTQSKEQDLSSTERFELQTESQTVINSTASQAAGVTIHASYGPSVDATSNFNFSSTSSKQQSNLASSSFAREVTTKAVNQVQTRTLTRRVVTTIDVTEETNVHSFDNKSGANDVVGVYRFVDKIYQAQVVNYGKRLMLEFIVPEPAAFLRFAMTHRPLNDVTVLEPEQPGYCLANGTSFAPLQASDVTRENYLFWASKYGAQDVTPPPPSLMLASATKKSPDSMPTIPDSDQPDRDRKISSDVLDVPIVSGYLAQSAVINVYGETQAGLHRVIVQIQDQQGTYIEPDDDKGLFALRLQPTPTVNVSVNSIGFHNYELLALVLCTLSTEKFQEWQFATFSSIMNAYNEEKSRFDQAVAEARLQALSNPLSGTNPLNNRETEQTELKKGCISLLTGQRFDLFDAVSPNIAPFGYPEIDFAEARAEGEYLQVFEQSFEWNNMTYVFYPYFWGKKDEWPSLAQLSDDDPLFARFLRAGAARVQVPVRLGFEQSMLSYLSTGQLWSGDGTVMNSDGTSPDQLHLSVLDELKSQIGDNNVEGVGTVNVQHNNVNVTGSGTAFTADDEDRRIQIAGKSWVINTVVDSQNIKLTTAFTGDNGSNLGYSLGGKLIGQPWEVKLPTDLIKLDNSLAIT